ncbi:MAG: T9SS type A sorting domain-containing protein, partial [Candidatus Kapabacteria bacterium]|nr:T9SS type A sorting domain-containing protein [Candidatus Kapabacteria bacterium]
EVSNECGTVVSSDVQIALSSVEEDALAAGYWLRVHPQPMGSEGVVEVRGPVGSVVRVEIVDISGRVVLEVWRGELGSGLQRIALDVTMLPAGVYRCVLQSGKYRLSTPVVVVR